MLDIKGVGYFVELLRFVFEFLWFPRFQAQWSRSGRFDQICRQQLHIFAGLDNIFRADLATDAHFGRPRTGFDDSCTCSEVTE